MTTIPDHLIDKAARAFQRLTCRGPLPEWEDTPAYIQDVLREDASAILDAVADDLRAEAWDEGCEAFEIAHKCDNVEPWGHLRDNPYRATETGGQA